MYTTASQKHETSECMIALVVHGINPGPRPYLTPGEEKELGIYLKHCAKVGYGKTRRSVLALIQTVASDRGVLRSSQVSEGWWRRFLK